ncbi:hypothetical protein FB45DRAFT_1122592 [Roridomyces roridus]|uniref:Uncharacterized protein n=1 Tax=Roridomyces roridus TaxID=1738132 RepID=A0AAD7F948_9AGAR|nr:hypothetical protein FB45DRAFT_1122592 [Roridomyces roridus]
MSSSTSYFIQGGSLLYHTFTLVVQTFFFGGYSVLILISTRMLLTRGLKTRSLEALFFLGLLMYAISSAFWGFSVAYIGVPIVTSFNAIVLINFVLSDGIVCWRAWVISRMHYRGWIWLPFVFWFFTMLSTSTLIVFRSIDIPDSSLGGDKRFIRAIDVLQLQNMTTSLLSNISATGFLGATAWRHRQAMRTNFEDRKRSRVNQVLALLIESGVLYCMTGVLGTISQLVHLPHGTLNDIVLPVNIQFAGACAPALLLLISHHSDGHGNDTEYVGTLQISARPERAGTIQFTPGLGNRRVMSTIRFAVSNRASQAEADSEESESEFGRRSWDSEDGEVEMKRRELKNVEAIV